MTDKGGVTWTRNGPVAHEAPEPQHYYESGVYHDTPPDGPIFPCCDRSPDDPIHKERPPDRLCTCLRVTPKSRRHYWSPTLGCPKHSAEYDRYADLFKPEVTDHPYDGYWPWRGGVVTGCAHVHFGTSKHCHKDPHDHYLPRHRRFREVDLHEVPEPKHYYQP